jgi:mannose-6-phosphate isomerase
MKTDILWLRPDRFTKEIDTPWGGTRIYESYKKHLLPENPSQKMIGESWEFSCDPKLPSLLLGSDQSLLTFLETHPGLISQDNPRAIPEILLKILDAKEPLSFQVHPGDGDPFLGPMECGKPEAWLILGREEGAGVYLGFKESMTKKALQCLLADRVDLTPYLQFIPVQPGDYFEIPAGVPHGIGGGVTLLEPQRVLPGRSGKTYRIWDWGRLSGGLPRTLHQQEALALIDPEKQWGWDFAQGLKKPGKTSPKITSYQPSQDWHLSLIHLKSDQEFTFKTHLDYAIFLSLEGELELQTEKNSFKVAPGQSALLPCGSNQYRFQTFQGARCALVSPRPQPWSFI